MHPGAYVVGGLIGGLILSGLNKPTLQEAGAYADVAIRIGGIEFIGVEFVPLAELTHREALTKALTLALRALFEEIASRP
jgi:hypothetical protein